MQLNLNRPICFFDLETTGVSITLDKIVEIKSEDKMNLEIDPRSKTTADGAFNYIPTGDKEKVRGQKRMLAEKKKPATWY